MDLRSMESFVTLCRYRNYTHAAEHLFISQPALSKRINNIEIELGFQLIDRDSPTFKLTPLGVHLLQECENILHAYAQMEQRINRIRSGAVRPLTVYVRHLPASLIAPCVAEMSHTHPEVEFVFKSRDIYTDSAKLLVQGEADIVLGIRDDFEKYQGITYRVFAKNQHGILVGVDHPYYNKASLSTADLMNYKMALFYNKPSSNYTHPIHAFLKEQGYDPKNLILTHEKNIQLYYVATGKHLGYSSTNFFMQADLPGLIKCIPWIDCSVIAGDLSIGYRNNDPLAMQFSDILMNYANRQLT